MSRTSKSGGRKAYALARNEFDPKLQRVAHALDNLTRAGDLIASGTSERVPFPGLAFTRDGDNDDDELHFPVTAHDVPRIKACASAVPRHDAVWSVDGAALELRNPRWLEFLLEKFETLRAPLGIAPSAKIEISLNKLVLVEAGGRLPVLRPGNETRGAGVFGSLVVALPGRFDGGDFVPQGEEATTEELQQQQTQKTILWRPSARQNTYDLSIAALYDHSGYMAKPVTSGVAAFLVYDLVTTTPRDVPLFGGSALLERSVHTALSDFFDEPPPHPPAPKRQKTSPSGWRELDDFVPQRQFVYLVGGNSFDSLSKNEQQVARILAAYCGQHHSEYVLYHAGVLCSRECETHKGQGHGERLVKDDGRLKLTLKKPWLKHGTTQAATFPPINVNPERDVAPLAGAEDVELCVDVYDQDMADYDIVEKRHYNFRKTGTGNAFALVLQPASIEQEQLTKMPIVDVAVRARRLLVESRDEAVQYMRRVLQYRSPWKVYYKEAEDLQIFANIVLELNDLQLGTDLLQSVRIYHTDTLKSLCTVVDYFGWESCVDALVKSIQSTESLRYRVNLINAVVDTASDVTYISQMLDALLSHSPWTEMQAETASETFSDENKPDPQHFGRLLTLADAVSREKLMQVVSVASADELVRVVVPALESIAKVRHDSSLEPVIRHVYDLFQQMMPAVRNEAFAKIRLPQHCNKCVELQAFLSSTETQATLCYEGSVQRKHIERVLESKVTYPADVKLESASGSTVRLTKNHRYGHNPAKDADEKLRELLRPQD